MKYSILIDQKLSTLKFKVDTEKHISVDSAKCAGCMPKPCLVCPAACYIFDENSQKLITNFDGCLECATCRKICPYDSIRWNYPRGGFGVTYRFG